MYRVNVGCGMTPTDGWLNFDGSLSVKLSKFPTLVKLLYKFKFIRPTQFEFIQFCRKNTIVWADVTKKIPLSNNSVGVLYTSHMLDFLDREEARMFLKEVNRVLAPGGIIRIAITDLEKKIQNYLHNNDADIFIKSTSMSFPRPRKLIERLQILIAGTKQRQWMYDKKSLSKLLIHNGFINPTSLIAGDSLISNPTPLDLFERADESLYVEAIKATTAGPIDGRSVGK